MIPGARPGQRLSGLFAPWSRVRARAGLDDVRLHDLRHSYASRALALGESLPVIAKLLGHAQIQTTARYTHLARDAVKDAATRVAQGIAEDILPAGRPDSTARSAARRNGCAIPRGGRIATGTVRDLDVYNLPINNAKASVMASAARVAADIGDDILPPWKRNIGLASPENAADAAA